MRSRGDPPTPGRRLGNPANLRVLTYNKLPKPILKDLQIGSWIETYPKQIHIAYSGGSAVASFRQQSKLPFTEMMRSCGPTASSGILVFHLLTSPSSAIFVIHGFLVRCMQLNNALTKRLEVLHEIRSCKLPYPEPHLGAELTKAGTGKGTRFADQV